MNLAATALTLFLVFDPFGNMVIFHTILAKVAPEKRRRVMIRELIFALIVLLGFLLAGSTILSVLGVRPATLSISGGILLFLIALGMVFPAKSMLTDATTDEPFIVPLAVPLIAGPSSIALLLLLANKYPDQRTQSALALGIAWGAAALILLISPLILKLLGNKGTAALERLMGLLLILIAVQMFLDGLAAYTHAGPS
ncbi:YhgN family NAAT transporter [Luteolibacter ambystomatis]|uniref:UPF0056 membrane protein n=1 Tax=Luteolibacter ambystomatis TaxID=2824561 RepID=A0A975G906_9BACT|nr:YhgN family NAAT transporter [Luteolibacter ambystomatis]QUE50915.1 YhgN family NAAT transporter [Luteolibacter ambystomatis]